MVLLTLNLAATAHEYYLSITKIEWNAKSSSFEVSIKLTAHDLERVLEADGGEKLNLGSDIEASDADERIVQYLKKVFGLTVNGESCNWSYVGKEVNLDDNMWVYIEIPNIKEISSIEVKNGLLMDMFPAQQNHIHLKLSDETKTIVLMGDKRQGELYSK